MTRLRLLSLLSPLFGGLLAAAFVAGAPSAARADDPEPEVSDQAEEPAAPDPMHRLWDRLLGVELQGGVDTPYGVIGGSLLVQPIRNLRLDLGGGVSRDGGRVAGGVTLVLPQDHFALMLRVGFAGGPLSWDSDFAENVPGSNGTTTYISHVHRFWSFAAFLDTSLGLEYHFDEGVLLRAFFGVETTLNDTADACSSTGGTCSAGAQHDHPARLFAGLSVGYLFDIF